ncbi:MAG: hypothetical protein ACE5K2_02445, partial [Candidatus Zixiibacteriota bacterium]
MSTRQKRLSFLLSVVFILSICGNLFGQAEFDYKQINLLRWMDPDRKPITYEEYLESRHFAKEFRTRCIYSSFKGMNPKGVTPLCIIVNNLLQPQIETAFLRFITDLEMEGYGINLYTATNNGDEEALKELLISEWNTRQIVGVILIGDLAVPWYEMTEPEDWGGNHVEF